MDNQSLRYLAWTFKVVAIFESVVIPFWLLPPRWDINPIAYAQLVGLAVLALIPNRSLVFSRISFVIFLLLTLFPFRLFLDVSVFRDLDVASVTAMVVLVMLFAPLPLSLVLSRIRFLRGEKFLYA
jgi:hypothetical protein